MLANVQLAEHVRVTAEPLSDAATRLVEGEVIDRLADIAPLLRCVTLIFSRPHACSPLLIWPRAGSLTVCAVFVSSFLASHDMHTHLLR